MAYPFEQIFIVRDVGCGPSVGFESLFRLPLLNESMPFIQQFVKAPSSLGLFSFSDESSGGVIVRISQAFSE